MTKGGDGIRSKRYSVAKRTLFHPIVARIEGKQQNGPISETRWPQAGHKVCQPAEEDGPEQEPGENEQSPRSQERQSLSRRPSIELALLAGSNHLAAVAAQAFEQAAQFVDGC